MDWAKAKSVLIIAFIITNIILGYNLYIDKIKTNKDVFFQQEYIEDLNKLLKTKNIKVDCDLPTDIPKLSILHVKYETLEDRNFRHDFPKTNRLEVIGNKKIIYTGKVFLRSFSKNEVKIQSEKFINNHNFNKNSYLKYITKKNSYFEVVYSGEYKEYYLDESYMKFKFYPNGDVIFERLWLIPIKENNQKKQVITSVESIMNSFDNLNENSTVQEIKLVYCFIKLDKNMGKLAENMDLERTKAATAYPAWRIKTNDNKYYYTPAFDF